MSLITISSIFEQDFDDFCDFCGNTCVSFLIDTTGYEDGLTEYIFRPIWFRYLHTPIKFSNDEKGKEAFLRNFCNQLNEVVFDFYTYCKENIDYFMYQTDPLNEGKPMSKNITSGINPINQNVDQAVDSTNLATGTSGQFITETVYNGVAWHKLVDAYFTPNRKTSLLKAFAWLFVTTYSPETKYDDKIEEKRYVQLDFIDDDNNIIDEQKVLPTKPYFTMSEVNIQRPLMLDPQNVKKDIDIAGVVGTYEPNIISNVNANSDLTQNQEINVPSGYDGMAKVTVVPPATAIPSNIKKDVNIGGVVGTYEPNILNFLDYPLDLTGDMDIEAGDYNVDGIREVFIGIPTTARAENIKAGVNIGGIVGTYTADNLHNRITTANEPYEFTDNVVTTLKPYCFYNDTNITSFSSTSLTSLSNFSFSNCSNLETFNAPNLATFSNNYTSTDAPFRGTKIKTMTLPSATNLRNYTFYSMSYLEELYMPALIGTFWSNTGNIWNGCSSLRKLVLGNGGTPLGVSFVTSGQFTNCNSLVDITFNWHVKVSCSFSGITLSSSNPITVRVPSDVLSLYQADSTWAQRVTDGTIILTAIS